MRHGEAFDPVEVRKQRIFPADVLDSRIDVSDGPKRLYAKLSQLALTADRRQRPWKGYIEFSESYLAKLLGKSESGVRRDMAVLRDLRFIRTDRPNRQKHAQHVFLWHPDFDRANVSGQGPEESAPDRANLGNNIFDNSSLVR